MVVRTRFETVEKDIDLLISRDFSPKARSEALAQFARDTLAKAQANNAQVLGQVPSHDTIVDGRTGAAESSVKPEGGVIIYEFDLVFEAFAWIGEQLVKASPVGKGRYRSSFQFFANGVSVDPKGQVPPADEYVFMNTQPYSRKIERGLSDQAREGVFQVVAAMAQRRFGNVAKIVFGFRTPTGLQSNISRVGPLQVKRDGAGRFVKGSHVRAGNQVERMTRQPAIIIFPR